MARIAEAARRIVVRFDQGIAGPNQELSRYLKMSRSAFENLTAAVTTINAPMPMRIDERTLLACLKGEISEPKWRVYVQALFDEVDASVLHGLVIDHLLTFDDLLKAIDIWHVTESENERWVREMASFEVGRPHGEGAAFTR